MRRRSVLVLPWMGLFGMSGCIGLFFRVLLGRGLARGLRAAAGRIGKAASMAHLAAGTRVATVATFARAASPAARIGSALRSNSNIKRVPILQQQTNRRIGSIVFERNSNRQVITHLRNERENTLLASRLGRNERIVEHYDFTAGGLRIGHSVIRQISNHQIVEHFDYYQNKVGHDVHIADRVEHYDQYGKRIGTTNYRIEGKSAALDTSDPAIAEVMDAYAGSLILSDERISKLYEQIRDLQHQCYGEYAVEACREISVRYAIFRKLYNQMARL